MPEHANGMANISTDTHYLAIHGMPLTQTAIEQLERAWLGQEMADVNWVARVVLTHGVGDERYAHDVAIGQLRPPYPDNGKVLLVAVRISEVQDEKLRDQLRRKPLGLLMF